MSLDGFLRRVMKVLVVFNILLVILLVLKVEVSWTSNMVFYISPMHQSIDSYNNEIKTATFKLETQSNYLCTIECNYEFIDVSGNVSIDKGNLTFSRLNDSIKSYEIKSPMLGAGQKIYNFDVACSNKRTLSCWFKNPKRYTSSIVVLNYRLREEEESIKTQLKNTLQNILSKMSYADIINQENEIKISDTDAIVNFNEISEEIKQGTDNFTSIRGEVLYLKELWDGENYLALNEFMNSSLEQEVSNAIDILNETSKKIDELISRHNILVNSMEIKRQNTKAMLNLLLINETSDVVLNEINNFLYLFGSVFDNLKNKSFVRYSDIEQEAKSLSIPYKKIKAVSDADFAEILDNGYTALNQNYDLMCSLKGYCINHEKNDVFDEVKSNILQTELICKRITELNTKFKEADDSFILQYYAKLHPATPIDNAEQAYNNLSLELNLTDYNQNPEFIDARDKKLQNRVIAIKNNYTAEQNEVSKMYNRNISILNADLNYSVGSLSNKTSFDYCEYLIESFNFENSSVKKQLMFTELKNACEDYLNNHADNENFTAGNISSINNIKIEDELPPEQINISNDIIKNLPEDIFILTTNLTYTKDIENYQNIYCSIINTTLAGKKIISAVIQNTSFLESELDYATAKKYNITTRINTTLEEHFPVCCVFGECERCCINESCRNEPSLFPVIMLHGHAFNKEESPTFSLDIFDKIYRELQKDGYINAGIILPNPNYTGVKENELGAVRKPASIKATYYIDFNSENWSEEELAMGIENYTSRLNDIIQFVMFRTGKSKVNIIAHSMGALVARRYLQIYGENYVDKLIMISAPNQGISERTEELCLIAGRERECYDMVNNSNFMKQINSVALKNKTKLYNIYGSGCDTNGESGDTIIPAYSTMLPNAENYEIKVNCTSVFDVPHLEILDIDKYPETYSAIKSILKQN